VCVCVYGKRAVYACVYACMLVCVYGKHAVLLWAVAFIDGSSSFLVATVEPVWVASVHNAHHNAPLCTNRLCAQCASVHNAHHTHQKIIPKATAHLP